MRLFGMIRDKNGAEVIKELPPFALPEFDLFDWVSFYTDDKRDVKIEGSIVAITIEKFIDTDFQTGFIVNYIITGEDSNDYDVPEDLIVQLITG